MDASSDMPGETIMLFLPTPGPALFRHGNAGFPRRLNPGSGSALGWGANTHFPRQFLQGGDAVFRRGVGRKQPIHATCMQGIDDKHMCRGRIAFRRLVVNARCAGVQFTKR